MSEPKHEKFALRVTARQKAVIEHAARLQQMTMTSFIVDKAYQAAAAVILEQRHLVLNDRQWQAFASVLNAPAKDLPQLHQLFSQTDIWEA
jgi:uncharacterized protein (DUF1778 family)